MINSSIREHKKRADKYVLQYQQYPDPRWERNFAIHEKLTGPFCTFELLYIAFPADIDS